MRLCLSRQRAVRQKLTFASLVHKCMMASSVLAMRSAPAAAAQSPARESLRCRSSFVGGSGSAFRTGSNALQTTVVSYQRRQPSRQVHICIM